MMARFLRYTYWLLTGRCWVCGVHIWIDFDVDYCWSCAVIHYHGADVDPDGN